MSKAVLVGCKIPMGIICELGKVGEPGYKRVVLNGSNSARVINGYGFTQVDETFIRDWMKKNEWLDAVRIGAIFVQSGETEFKAQAVDTADLVTGFERLNPEKTPDGIEVDKQMLDAARKDNIKQMHGGAGNPDLGLGNR